MYWTRWLEIPVAYYANCSVETQQQIGNRITELRQNPYPSDADYDAAYDNWTTTFGNGSGIITYAVVEQDRCILILRLLSL